MGRKSNGKSADPPTAQEGRGAQGRGRGRGRGPNEHSTGAGGGRGNGRNDNAAGNKTTDAAPRPGGGRSGRQGQDGRGGGRGGGRGRGRGARNNESRAASRPNDQSVSSHTAHTKVVHASRPSPNIDQYWKKLISSTNIPSLRGNSLWKDTWAAAAAGAEGDRVGLLRVYMRQPDMSTLYPGTDCLLGVLVLLLKDVIKKKITNTNLTEQVSLLQMIYETIQKRMMQRLDVPAQLAHCADVELSQNYQNAVTHLLHGARDPSVIQNIAELLQHIPEIVKYEEHVHEKALNPCNNTIIPASSVSSAVWTDWQHCPSVNWLLDGRWVDAPALRNTYETPEEYSETMLRIWVLLTFYWGAGALWPKCLHKQGTASHATDPKLCGEPLLTMCSRVVQCRSRGCNNNATWTCHRFNHESVCDNCLRKHQMKLCGPAIGADASTDVYDAHVDCESVRHDGTVYMLSRVQSRKPPLQAPSWRTTYRLNCSVLVGIVKLHMSGESIFDKTIIWAEIVPMNAREGNSDDWKNREKQRMAVRLLTRSDCEGLPEESECLLEAGCHVAIIDLRVFVPEVVSVLSTFAKKSFTAELSQIPFIRSLIGHHADHHQEFVEFLKANRDHNQLITEAIIKSNMSIVRRMPHIKKYAIAKAICDIPAVQSLSGTQLDAFTSALICDVHCTQGPPGTGKSYLGVCLVLAMITIRQQALEEGEYLGPIVVLSYKNHALDEFLCDVVNGYSNSWNKKLRSGQLIRCGHPEHDSLQIFSERRHDEEIKTRKALNDLISVLRIAREKSYDLWDCANHLELCTAMPWMPRELYQSTTSERLQFSSKLTCNYATVAVITAVLALTTFVEKCSTTGSENEQYEISAAQSVNALKQFFALCPHKLYSQPQTLSKKEMIRALKSYVNIISGAEHWGHELSQSEQMIFLIDKYLNGMSPPPRCAYINDKQCMQCSSGRLGTYCAKFHECTVSNCFNMRNVGIADVCVDHQCQYCAADGKACNKAKHKHSLFCTEHSCVVCLLCNVEPQAAQPNACTAHTCADPLCNEKIVLPHAFCELHCCSLCLKLGQAQSHGNAEGGLCSVHKCSVHGCTSARKIGTDACAYHTCIDCESSVDSGCSDSHLCVVHRCAAIGCKRRHLNTSIFCVIHSCKVCLQHDIFVSELVSAPYPRNVCSKHPLCNGILKDGRLCNEVAVAPGIYCETHINIQDDSKGQDVLVKQVKVDNQCYGMKKKGGRCKAKRPAHALPNKKWYCDGHKGQDDAEEESSDDEEEEGVALEEAIINIPLDDDLKALSTMQPADFINWNTNDVDNECRKFCCGNEACSQFIYASGTSVLWHCPFHEIEDVPLHTESHAEVIAPSQEPASHLNLTNANIDKPRKCASVAKVIQLSQKETDGVVLACEGYIKDESAYDIPLDEMDDEFGRSEGEHLTVDDEEEMSNNLQHLRDVMDMDEESSSDNGDAPDEAQIQYDNDGSIDRYYIKNIFKEGQVEYLYQAETELSMWSWEFNHEKRLHGVAKLLRFVSIWINEIKNHAYPCVETARRQHSESRAIAFKQAKIVGATVVGASRRLEAIRAAEPFAIVVEEACEVMEPALMSVLAVRSLCKLELVGDHRQLPAFVQQCWYNLEMTHRTIKTSLFERLVTGSSRRNMRDRTSANDDSIPIPCTILDEQRRMRKEIADITRPEYSDLVEIIDHSSVHTQCVGDRYIQSVTSKDDKNKISFELHRKSFWHECGRCVPGASSNVYFWDIPNNAQSRPIAGLSACNETEAIAAAGLCRWFMNCGVPGSCITVITPYKGQKTLLIKCLRQVKCIPPANKNHSNDKSATVNVLLASTVDRYQGDENDIVILSLVRVSPGNRFVGLVNRFIVGTSRARLGFYVLGSKTAIVGLPHWQRFLEQLEQPLKGNDQPHEVDIESRQYEDNMPPVMAVQSNTNPSDHRNTKSSRGLLGFFKSLHRSMLTKPDDSVSNMPSAQNVMRSSNRSMAPECSKQPAVIRIGNTFPLCCPTHRASKLSVKDPKNFPECTLSKWRADICCQPCQYILPRCGHRCGQRCHVVEPNSHTNRCMEQVARPCIIHSNIPLVCHSINESNPDTPISISLQNFKCDIIETILRSKCQHEYALKCHDKKLYRSGELKLPHCVLPMENYKLSCGHVIKTLTCKEWQEYEVNPPVCNVKVSVRLSCDHLVTVSCHEAQQPAFRSKTACKIAVTQPRPRCLHNISIRCSLYTYFHLQWQKQDGLSASTVNGCVEARSGVSYGPSEGELLSGLVNIPPCTEISSYRRSCGHLEKNIPCNKAFSYALDDSELSACVEPVKILCPFCSRIISVPCDAVDFLNGFAPFGDNVALPQNADGKVVIHQTLLNCDLGRLSKDIVHILQRACSHPISVVQSCPSSHSVHMKCCDLISIMLKKTTLPKCTEIVTKKLSCGHSVDVQCCNRDRSLTCRAQVSDRYLYSCGIHTTDPGYCSKLQQLRQDNPPCPELIDCRLHRCGHLIRAPCSDKKKFEQIEIGESISRHTLSSSAQPIVVSGASYCANNEMNILCKELVTYQRDCGHLLPNVQCCDAFTWAIAHLTDDSASDVPRCTEQVEFCHPACNHMMHVDCWIKRHASRNWKPWEHCRMPTVEKITQGFDAVTGVPLCRDVVQQPIELPSSYVYSSKIKCNEMVELVRFCGHEQLVPCSEAYFGSSPCRSMVEMRCINGHPWLEQCHEAVRQYESGDYRRCCVPTSRVCQVCNINIVDVECFKSHAECQSEVTVERECGHTIKWKCGEDEDPRNSKKLCVFCTVLEWEHALSCTVTEFDFNKLLAKLQHKVGCFLRDVFTESSIEFWEDTRERFAIHRDARFSQMRIYKDYMMKEGALSKVIALPPPLIGAADDVEAYTLLFAPVASKDLSKSLCELKETTYGRGVEFYDLLEQNVRKICTPVNGKALMVVGVICRNRLLRSTPPFAKKSGHKGIARANQAMSHYQALGYDGVEILTPNVVEANGGKVDDEDDDDDIDAPLTRPVLYWAPGAFLALGVVEVKLLETCLVCMCDYNKEDGYMCTNNHFLCWNCLQSYGESALGDDAMPQHVDNNGNVKCVSCTEIYTVPQVAAQAAPNVVIDILMKVQTKIQTKVSVLAAVEAERNRLRAEFDRIQAIQDADERNANILRSNIVDNILTLRCPRQNCRGAFIDFDGCFALTCGNCQCGFCAWCLKDCGDDAHSHVRNCPENRNRDRSVHGSLEMFNKHHCQRRQRLIEKRLDDAEERVAYIAYDLLTRDVEDTGITLKPRQSSGRRPAGVSSLGTTLQWTISPARNCNGMKMYTIHTHNVPHTVVRESYEFDVCGGRFSRLLRQSADKIKQVDVIEYDETSSVRKSYEETIARFQRNNEPIEETWVFHGTRDINIRKIIERGFVVGGEDPNVPVVNGRAYGAGVYTATSPRTPLGYGGGRVILAVGLKGANTSHSCPIDDYIIFRQGCQLLPRYVVHYN